MSSRGELNVKLWQYILKRILQAIPVLLGLIFLTFFIVRILPADPALIYVGERGGKEALEAARIKLGLNKPLYEQFFNYVVQAFSGDWGLSLRTHTPVFTEIMNYFPATLELVFYATLLGLVVGVALGVISASRGGLIDHFCRLSTISFISVPAFVLALFFQLVFYGTLRIFPSGGRLSDFIFLTMPIQRITGFYTIDTLLNGNLIAFIDCIWHLTLPTLTLSFYSIGSVTKMTRSMMLETLQEDYILFARASGLKESLILYKYALKNSIIPSLTVVGLSFAHLVTGAFTTELIFGWPGLGWFTSASLIELDYPAVIGVVLIGTVFYVGINILIDVLQAYLDPRVRLK